MDSKKTQSNSIKTIVPIKGNLLAKIKDRLQNKEPSVSNTEVNDVINNNQNSLDLPQIVIKQKPVKSKVIIQKVEKVNLEISDILGDCSLQNQPITSPIPTTNVIFNEKNIENEEKRDIVTSLDEKIPENDSNKKTPQKMVRTLRKPKLVPKIPVRKRVGNTKIIHEPIEIKLDTENNIQPFVSISKIEPMDTSEDVVINNENVIAETSKSIQESTMQEENEEAVKSMTKENEIPVNNNVLVSAMNKEEEGNSFKGNDLAEDSNEKDDEQEQEDDDMNMDLNESTWLNDISLLLGENRIKEIDQSLKKIPAIVKGNKIQTENVELKLIINHLLGKLQAKSVTDTLIMPSTSGFQSNNSANFDFSDMFDSITEDDFSKDSTFFNENFQPVVEDRLDDKIEMKEEVKPNQKDLNELPNTTENEICVNSKQNLETFIRKRRGRLPRISRAKRMKKETCESNNMKSLSPRESSVDSQKVLTRTKRRLNRIKDSSPESSFEKSPKNSVITISQTRRLRSSSRDKSIPSDASIGSEKLKKKVTRVQELKNSEFSRSDSSSSDCETEEVKKKRGRKKKQQLLQSIDRINTSSAQAKRSSRIAQKSSKTVGALNKNKVGNIKKGASKNILSSDSECESLSTPSELKLNSSLNNFNSNFRSSIIERNDYIKSSSVDKPKNELTSHPKIIELEKRLKNIKDKDPTYRTPQAISTKRPYLRTSAFKNGNDNSNIVLDSTIKHEPSVSLRDSNGKTKNGNVTNLMKDLIEKQKQKINDPSSPSSSSFVVDASLNITSLPNEISISKTTNNRRNKITDEKKSTKMFKQEELRNSDESKVMYEDILEAIRISDPKYKKWRKDSKKDEKLENVETELKKLQHFRCGNCSYLVTKHMWKEHLIKHGGLAWIDKYEHSINIDNWNEAIRRLINILKIYKLDFFRCANCGQEKKSALGHLSHVYICAQDEETIEKRKVNCKFCDERILPYNVSAHRSKCKGLNLKEEAKEQIESSDNNEDDECSNNSSIQSGGRSKRKAVKKAEKKLKTIVNELKSQSQEDFSDTTSSSAASLHDESSDETEGSSGVESSDIETVDENDDDNDDSINNSYRKGKPTVADTEELKTSRKLVSTYVESFQKLNITSKTIPWTKNIYKNHLSKNILTELAPKYKILPINLSSFLHDIKLKSLSMKFNSLITENYNICYLEKQNDNNIWQELEVGKKYYDKQSLTLFCGGSVSGLDWAQTNDHINYLAVACNSNESLQSHMKLEQTQKSCIQVYKMQHLVNEKLNSYEDVSQLLYMFSMVDGPIWSIKFHPFIVASDDRIGLLAVSTANQNVLIFSLPCLKSSNENLIVTIEPSIICKLSEENIFFQDKYLLQVTTINWHYREDQIQLLTAGYLNGFVSIWMIDDDHVKSHEHQTLSLLPYLVFQPHHEIVTSIDFKTSLESEILMLTASLDREIKVFEIENGMHQEIASHKANSRNTCVEWCLNWPGYVFGNDNCYACPGLNYRQPLEFAARNLSLLQSVAAMTDLSINHWLNYFIYVCDSGDVFASNPKQLLHSHPKDRWQYFNNTILSYTDIIELNEKGEFGIIFNDVKSKKLKRPKSFRIAPTKFSQQLQINSVRFNRNETSHHFYAIGYETGFVRIMHLKNSK
ncbi:hypothetical protein PVAND_002657 [Polypedilum vanderplanki]|uniref:Uncharacterized protein n=1 Tax=Polypedilum vanderplanki TaxID=319348 RepID=A0A9J6BRU4_POLVA|nr:hypothetical protein PVAND_002657 [Polypedilum vanderplanki]